jgi:N-glycosylase/DNA lyase
MKSHRQYRALEDLHEVYALRKDAVRARLAEFAAVPASDYYYELAYCLLTPQSSAANAEVAVRMLKKGGLLQNDFNPSVVLDSRSHYIRFHNTKGRWLLEAKKQLPDILTVLKQDVPSPLARSWLARNVLGLGWKEASHFLRNIGHRNLAILDRHILRNLKRHGVIRAIPRTLTPSRYLKIEERFAQFAAYVGIPLDELDLVFWSRETGKILK